MPAFATGGTDIRCALDPRPAPDGSLTGSRVLNRRGVGSQESPSRIDAGGLFPRAGVWACVARSVAGGVTPGPWSAPTATEIVQNSFFPPADGGVRLVDPRSQHRRAANIERSAGSQFPGAVRAASLLSADWAGGQPQPTIAVPGPHGLVA